MKVTHKLTKQGLEIVSRMISYTINKNSNKFDTMQAVKVWIARKLEYNTFEDMPQNIQDAVTLGLYGGALVNSNVYSVIETTYE